MLSMQWQQWRVSMDWTRWKIGGKLPEIRRFVIERIRKRHRYEIERFFFSSFLRMHDMCLATGFFSSSLFCRCYCWCHISSSNHYHTLIFSFVISIDSYNIYFEKKETQRTFQLNELSFFVVELSSPRRSVPSHHTHALTSSTQEHIFIVGRFSREIKYIIQRGIYNININATLTFPSVSLYIYIYCC